MSEALPEPADFLRRERRSYGLGVRGKTLVLLVLAVFAMMLLVGMVVMRVTSHSLKNERIQAAGLATRLLANDLGGSEGHDQRALARRLSRAVSITGGGIKRVTVYDFAGKALVSAPPHLPAIQEALPNRQEAVLIAGERGGSLFVPGLVPESKLSIVAEFEMKHVEARIQRAQDFVILYMLLDALLILGVAYVLLTRQVTRPLRRFAEATHKIAEGDLDAHVSAAGIGGDVESLADDFNAMTARIRSQQQELRAQLLELEARNEQLELAHKTLARSEKLASVGRLSAGVAHEIGNPLAAMLGYVEFLSDDDSLTPEERGEVVERLGRQIRRIDTIIRDLLDYARPDTDDLSSVSVAEAVSQAYELVKAQPSMREVEVETAGASDLLVRANAGRLHQVIVNLLLNAADAMEGRGSIHLRWEAYGVDRVRLWCADTGPGVDESAHAHLFDPFFTTKAPGEGTGLGLSICHTIVESMGGEVWLDESEVGARFCVELDVPEA